MARLAILEYPDPRLKTRASPVTTFGSELSALIDDLFETLYSTQAIGLAATQVDVHLRVIVMDVSEARNEPRAFINPEILERAVPGIVEESCLSLPGVIAHVRRSTRVRVRYHKGNGATGLQMLEGIAAVCLQHEVDHLDGRLSVDHLSFFTRRRIRRQMLRAARTPDPRPGATPEPATRARAG